MSNLSNIIKQAQTPKRYSVVVNGITLEFDKQEKSCSYYGGSTLSNSALDLTDEQIKAFVESWKENELRIEEIKKDNTLLRAEAEKEIASALEALNLPTYGVKGGRSQKFKKLVYKMWEQITLNHPDRPYIREVRISKDVFIQVDNGHDLLSVIRHSRIERNKLLVSNNKAAKHSILVTEYALRFGLNPYDSDIEEQVDYRAKEDFLKDNYPDGLQVDFDGCECGIYTIGETRCSCETYRISTEIEGELGNYYGYAVKW